MRFPTATGSNLERRRFTVPTDLDGDLNLVVLAFWRWQQALVDTWMPLAERLEDRFEGFVAYELPVISSRSRLSQWFIDSGMRAGIPDRKVRDHTITLYLDKPRFLEALDIDDDTVHTMIVDRSGRVLWHTPGPLDGIKESELIGLLERQLASAT